MPATWHPPEDVLLEYATGAASEMVSLLTATHLALCPACRATADALDAVGGALVGRAALDPPVEAPAAIDPLTAVFDPPIARARRAPAAHAEVLPEPLRSFVANSARAAWRTAAPGVQQMALTAAGPEGATLRLMRFAPGFTIPEHTHGGRELSLILTGGAQDERGTYLRGDVTARGDGDPHALYIHSDDPCLVLIVNLAPIRPTGLFARLLCRWCGL